MMLAAVDWHVVWQRLFHPNNVFWRALWTTVYIAIAAQLIGIVLGLVAALMRESKVAPLRWLSGLYVLVFRGTPVLVQLYFIYFGVNILFGVTVIPTTLHLGLFSIDGAVVAGILALGINEGAYMREIIRAGIDSIDKGQMEAAKSLGMRYGLAMRRIVLPQAARVIVPPLGNEFNNMLKTTSLMAVISFLPVEFFGAVAVWYLVLTTIWSVIQASIERRLAASERGDELSFRERVVAAWAPAGAFVKR